MLLFFHGTDAFLLRQAVADLIGSMRPHDGTALSVERIDCADEHAPEELERHLKYPSFFGDRKLIVATNAAGPVLGDIVDRYDLSTLDDIILVAVQDTSQKGTSKAVLAALTTSADRVHVCAALKGKTLETWVQDYCAQRNATIEPAATTELVHRVGEDTGRIASELAKLCAYVGGTPITRDAVMLLTALRPERDEWELSNALAAHDKRHIMTALWRKIQEGTPEQLLMGSVAAGLRNLLMVNDLHVQRQAPAAIAKLTGIHPFVISKTLRGAGSADVKRLTAAHLALARLDRDTKDGRGDAIDGMFALLLSL